MGSTHHHTISMAQRLTKDYVFIPSGREGDSLLPEFYISAIEVTNGQYMDFVNDLIDSGATAKLKIATADVLQWKKFLPRCGVYNQYYFQHPAFRDYPVVNVSRPAAVLYCDWLTDRYNAVSKQKVRFSLPTEPQWEYAAKGGNLKALYPWPGNSLTSTQKGKWHGTNMCNYLSDTLHTDTYRVGDTIPITAPSRSYIPNTYGIYDMGGNVAEMIAGYDYTKGGSYLSHEDKLKITAHEDADLAHGQPMIGFRPVMVYVKGE